MNQDPKNQKNKMPNTDNDDNKGRRIMLLVVAALVATLLINMLYNAVTNAYLTQISYTEFKELMAEDKISEVSFKSDDRLIILTKEEAAKKSQKKYYYTGLIPNQDTTELTDEFDRLGIAYNTELPEEISPVIAFVITWVVPFLALYLLFSLMRSMAKKMGGGGFGGIGGIGENKAKVYMEKQTGVTFADVAGQDEAKESLVEIIDFLHYPQKYAAIGAKLPKGALLVGSPGTGKTLLAKAVAGEANVPFFSISGSDFVEMFVGVGASRVRSLFQEANKVAPAIIFIDEIDAIGRTRDSRFGGNDEREQTLNQLLAEIDGFDSSKGVVILAATNRPEILDKALLRAGRFDRRIEVDRPNLQGRYQTLRVHTKNIKLAEDVDLHKIAQATAGAVGADLANLVNEAALRAVRQGRKAVNQQDLMVSFETVIAGTEKKGTVLTDMEKRIVSYHEVGHALVAALQKHTQPVSKITIVPHTSGALGYTMQLPDRRAGNAAGRPCCGAARIRRPDDRSRQRHRACDEHRPQYDYALRHERQIWPHGAVNRQQPVSRRYDLHDLRRFHGLRGRFGDSEAAGRVLRRCEEASDGKPLSARRDCALPAPEGDHHRRRVHGLRQRRHEAADWQDRRCGRCRSVLRRG